MGQGEPGGESASGRGGASRGLILGAAAMAAVAAVAGTWLVLQKPASAVAHVELGGPFVLVDQNGRPQTEQLLQGRKSALFFGYVSCPDICPATLQTLASAEQKLGIGPAQLQIVFISVDPARDTPAQLKAYLDQPDFPKQVVGLTGTAAQVAQAAKVYRAFYQKEGEGPNYAMAHSAAIYLLDEHGRFVKALTFQQGPDAVATELKSFLALP
ncbi:MAG: SCO family protein [Pseudomonadota bacterium]|jgi:protein SCO1/2